MSFGMTQEWKNSLLRKPELVRTDIFIQGLEPDEVEMIREASERGLKPGGFSVEGNTLVLRFDRNEFKSSLLSRKARLVVTEAMIHHVVLELVRLGREVPEASWHEGAEDYAVAMVRRLVEIARDETSS